MAMNHLYMTEIEELENFNEEAKQRFQVTDLASLNWAMRKLTAIEAKKREIRAMIDGEKERLEMFFERETSGLTESENFFKELVSQYAARKREEDPKFKGEKTPFGKIGFRKVPDKWLYDEELLVAYLEQNQYNELIRTKKEPVKTEIKKVFKVNDDGRVFDENGQEVAGITVEPQPEVLDIKSIGGAEHV
jgi:hypothetical protein